MIIPGFLCVCVKFRMIKIHVYLFRQSGEGWCSDGKHLNNSPEMVFFLLGFS